MAEAKILNSIKKLLGIDPEYDVFDDEIMIHINSVFSVMHQLGAAPLQGFIVVDGTETWDQYIGDAHHVQMIKTLTYMKVRLIFDPPASSSVLNSFESQIKELEWRLSIMEIQWNPNAYDSIDTLADQRLLARLNEKVNDLDEEVESVPNLSEIFRDKLGRP